MKRIALIVSLLIAVSGCYYILTKQQSAEAIIEFNSLGKAGSPKKSGSTTFTRSSVYTQFSIVRNQEVISRAIDDYNLDTLFETHKEILLKEIKENINTKQEKGSDQIFIKAFSDTEEKAQQICYAIIHSYDQVRREHIENTRNEVIAKYKLKVEAQEDKVEELRAKVYKLSKQLGIGYYNDNTQYLLLHYNSEEREVKTEEQILEDAKRERDILEVLVTDIKELDNKRLLARLLASNRPEATVLRADDNKLKKLKLRQSSLVSGGFAEQHPKITSLNTAIDQATIQLAESIKLTREKLGNDLVTMNKRINKVEEDILYRPRQPLSTTQDHTQFEKVKDEYEREFQILQSIKSAEFRQTIVAGLEIDPLQISQPGWTPEIEKMMLARKLKNK